MKRVACLILLFLISGCGNAEPTLVKTAGPLPTATPVPPTTTPVATWTLTPTNTPWSSPTPTPGVTITATLDVDAPVCDAELLEQYVGVVEQVESINISLEQQEFEESVMVTSISQLEQLQTQAEALEAPCDNAFWLRQMLINEIAAEVESLDERVKGRSRGRGDPIDYTLVDRLYTAVEALREVVEQEAEAPPEATNTPRPVSWDCSGDIYDCSYFFSQAEAQQAYEYCLPKGGDIHRLDEDGNGVACEDLP